MSQPSVAPRRIHRPISSIAQTMSISSSPSINTIQTSSLSTLPSMVVAAAAAAVTATTSPSPPPVPFVSPLPLPIPPVIQPRQYRLVYISDDDDETPVSTQSTTSAVDSTFNFITGDEEDSFARTPSSRHRSSRSMSGANLSTR
jgi:hypothetical protein